MTGVLAYNDLIAIGLLRAAQAAGLNIPQDLSIVGFDDIYGADLTNPPLTTIKVPLFTMGLLAANRILDLLQRQGTSAPDDTGDDRELSLTTSLVIRQSTASPDRFTWRDLTRTLNA